MDFRCVPRAGYLPAMAIAVVLGSLADSYRVEARAGDLAKPQSAPSNSGDVRDIRSRHFLIHTDIPPQESDELIERLEAMVAHFAQYCGRPPRGVIDCYIIRNLAGFSTAHIAPAGAQGVRTTGGVTLMEVKNEGKRQVANSVVYAAARSDVVLHEAIHAYCHQTFGRIGPVWYSEGMAELGRFWVDGDVAVRADQREIEYLRDHPPKSLAAVISPGQVTGDCWQNYTARWSLCHFLATNPNYCGQFRKFGRGVLAGKDIHFEEVFGTDNQRLFFEYLFFLKHITAGYRVDLCAWDWKRKFIPAHAGPGLTVTVAASRGWQPAGLSVRAGTPCEYSTAGAWQISGKADAVDADGDRQGRGRLVGVLMKDYQLGEEFELGSSGSLESEADGNLYLRCRNDWDQLAGGVGQIAVTFKLGGAGQPLRVPDGESANNRL